MSSYEPSTPQYQYLYSLCSSLYVSFGTDKENSWNNQSFLGWWSFSSLSCSLWIIQWYWKIRCWSMLVKRRTKLFFHSYFCSDVLISSLLFTREQHCSTANYRRYTTSCRRNRRWRGRTEGTWIPCTGAWVAGPRSWTSDEDVEVPYLRPSLKPKNSSPKRGFKERTWLRLI